MFLLSTNSLKRGRSMCITYSRGFNPSVRLDRLLLVQISSGTHANPPAEKSSAVNEICTDDEQRNEKRMNIDSLDLIETQKSRAIAQWEEAFTKEYFDDKKVYSNVLEQLRDGKVPPIYHTLCREPLKRLFLPDTLVSNVTGSEKPQTEEVINLSTEKVQAGSGTGTSDKQTIEEIVPDDDFPYLDAFFTENGKSRTKVWDDALEKNWLFNKKVTNNVTALVNTPAEMVGHDVEVTELISAFDVDKDSGRNLITRSLSRGVVADCFEKSNPRRTYAIVGSPGIGKSWTLIYALQQALLFENSCVMFCFQKKLLSWVCIRKNHYIYVWTMENDKFYNVFNSGLFKNGNVLALLDPGESKSKGASFSEDNRRLIYAASNNDRHFSSLLTKGAGFAKRILDPFSENELRVSLPFVFNGQADSKEYCIDTIIDRARIVGNLVRYIIDSVKFEERRKQQSRIITLLKNKGKDLEAIFNWDGISEEKESIPGTIFIVSAEKTGFGEDVGYDGERIKNYGAMTVSIISPYVRMEVMKQWRAEVLTYVGRLGSGDLVKMGEFVEDLFWEDLKKGVIMRCWKPGDSKAIKDLKKEKFLSCSSKTNVSIQELTKAVFTVKKGVVCRMMKGCPLIDFAGPGLNVFQVTVRDQHGKIFNGMKELLLAAGFLQYDKGKLSINKGMKGKKLNFFWVIPFPNRERWTSKTKLSNALTGAGTKSTKSTKITPSDIKIVKSCYQTYVDEKILFIEIEPVKQ